MLRCSRVAGIIRRAGPCPSSARLDPKSLVLEIVASGDFGAAELESIQAVTQDHAHDAHLAGMVVDVRGVDHVDVTTGSVRLAATRAREFEATQGLKMAVIADSELTFGLSRMYELMRDEDGSVRVFRDVDAATAWISGANT